MLDHAVGAPDQRGRTVLQIRQRVAIGFIHPEIARVIARQIGIGQRAGHEPQQRGVKRLDFGVLGFSGPLAQQSQCGFRFL